MVMTIIHYDYLKKKKKGHPFQEIFKFVFPSIQ